MRDIIQLDKKPYFLSYAAVGGYEERRGPLGKYFDFCDDSDTFSQKTFEEAEASLASISLNIALKKASLSPDSLNVLFSGDLENQCVASSGGLYSFGIPYLGLYSACSTCTEALLLLSILLSTTPLSYGASVTSSHNSAAERQFRTPLEYGAQRAPTAQWTATAAGAFVMSKNKFSGCHTYIDNVMIGKIVDGLSANGSNMGGAMARGAFDSIYTYFSLIDTPVSSFDAVVTGDLGYVGRDVLCDILCSEGMENIAKRHIDCGTLLYSKDSKNLNAGASGCGCSASTLASYFLPKLNSGEYKNILFLSTGALMNPESVMRGNNILGIAPIINIKSDYGD